jgi:hypothetical protein
MNDDSRLSVLPLVPSVPSVLPSVPPTRNIAELTALLVELTAQQASIDAHVQATRVAAAHTARKLDVATTHAQAASDALDRERARRAALDKERADAVMRDTMRTARHPAARSVDIVCVSPSSHWPGATIVDDFGRSLPMHIDHHESSHLTFAENYPHGIRETLFPSRFDSVAPPSVKEANAARDRAKLAQTPPVEPATAAAAPPSTPCPLIEPLEPLAHSVPSLRAQLCRQHATLKQRGCESRLVNQSIASVKATMLAVALDARRNDERHPKARTALIKALGVTESEDVYIRGSGSDTKVTTVGCKLMACVCSDFGEPVNFCIQTFTTQHELCEFTNRHFPCDVDRTDYY